LKFIPFEEIFGEKYKDIIRRIPDLTKAKTLLGYKPDIKLEDAIRSTIQDVKKRLSN